MKHLLTVLLLVSSSVFAGRKETIEVPRYVQNCIEADGTVTITEGTTTLESIGCCLVDMRSKQSIIYDEKLPLDGVIFKLIKESIYYLIHNN